MAAMAESVGAVLNPDVFRTVKPRLMRPSNSCSKERQGGWVGLIRGSLMAWTIGKLAHTGDDPPWLKQHREA